MMVASFFKFHTRKLLIFISNSFFFWQLLYILCFENTLKIILPLNTYISQVLKSPLVWKEMYLHVTWVCAVLFLEAVFGQHKG